MSDNEYADDFDPEEEPAPQPARRPPPPPTRELRPPAFEPAARPMSAKHGRRGLAQPPPAALAPSDDDACAEVLRAGAAGAARPWVEIGWDELELGDVFAHGGSGEVRVALWRGRRVAAKSLFAARSRLGSDQEAWRRAYDEYMGEILTMTAMAHPHIVALHGAVMQPDVGRCAMVLELCDCSLFELLHSPASQLLYPAPPPTSALASAPDDRHRAELRRPSACRAIAQMLGCEPALYAQRDEAVLAALSALGPAACSPTLLDRRALVRLMAEVASALEYAHGLVPSVVHRDIKSHNILLVAEGANASAAALPARPAAGGVGGAGGDQPPVQPQVSAKLADWGLVGTSTVDAGTANYMAPELFRRGPFSKSVDIYALGLVIWEVWCAEVPFDGYEPADIRAKVLGGERPALPSSMPSALGALVVECWDAEPARRPSAADAGRRLRDIALRIPAQQPRVCVARGGADAPRGNAANLSAHLANVRLADSLDALLR